MLSTVLITFVVMMLAVAGMAVGAMVANKPIKGSCGGIASQDGFDCACAAAGEKVCDEGPVAAAQQRKQQSLNDRTGRARDALADSR